MGDSQKKVGPLKKIWPWVRRFAFVAAVVLLVRLVLDNISQFRAALSDLNYYFLALAIVFSGLGFLVSSVAWRTLLAAQGVRVNIRLAWWSSAYSFIFRYLPGGVPGVAARVGMMRQFGVRLSHGSWTVMIEMGLSACAALIFFWVGGWGSQSPAWLNGLLALGFIIGIVAVALLTTKNNEVGIWRERLRLPTLGGRQVIPMILWFLAVWLTFGAAHWCLVQAMGLEKIIGFFEVSGVYAFSWVVGLVAVFTPSGLGVREATMIGLLQPLLGPAAIVFAVLSRLIFTAGELLNILIAWIFRPRNIFQTQAKTQETEQE